MKLSEMIDEKKFRNDMIEFLGFKDEGGTYLKEQYGDGSWHKIKKSMITDIISILDNCRKRTFFDKALDTNHTTMVFANRDIPLIKSYLKSLSVGWIERVKK